MTQGIIVRYEGEKLAKALQDFWKELLDRDIVRALLLPVEVEGGLVAPGLLTDSERVKESRVLSPYMPLNTARVLQTMTRILPPSEKMAVVLRPCELRATVELIKLKQISLDNLILISVDCLGTYPLEEYKKIMESEDRPEDQLLEKLMQGEEDERIREACRSCIYPVAPWADMRIGFLGLHNEGVFLIEALTERGEEVLSKLGMESVEVGLEGREKFLEGLTAKRKEGEQRLFENQRENLRGSDKLLSALSSCINCHNCMNVCPICYCKECFFDSPTFEVEADRYLGIAKGRGAARMPADILLFHLTRMAHMATSCVACGMCEDACPMGVPVFQLFKAVGAKAQELFQYEPGKSLEEELPLATFREKELDTVQEPKI